MLVEKKVLFSTVHLTPTNDLFFSVHNTNKYILVMNLANKKIQVANSTKYQYLFYKIK